MFDLVRMFVAWLLAMAGSWIIASVVGGRLTLSGSFDGILGIGLIIGLPMLLFAAVVALPLSFFMSHIKPEWAAAVCASLVFASVAWVLGFWILPDGWKGAQQATAIFALNLGLSWGLLGYVFPSTTASV